MLTETNRMEAAAWSRGETSAHRSPRSAAAAIAARWAFVFIHPFRTNHCEIGMHLV